MAKKSNNHYALSVIGLLIVALLWGFCFSALKFCENIPTFFTMSVRFTMAAVLLAIVFAGRLKNISKEIILVGVWVGILMFLCYLAATVGIKFTTSARSSFFSCLGAICVPLLNWLVYKEKITKKFFACMGICVAGVYLISMGGSGEIGLNAGDLICLLASFFGAAQLVALEHKGLHLDIICLTIVELFAIAVLSVLGMLIAGETIPTHFNGYEIGSLIFMGVFSTAISFVLQIVCVKNVPSNRTSIILTLEPVLGALSSVLIMGDVLGWQGYVGGLVIILSIIFSEYSSSVPALEVVDDQLIKEDELVEIEMAN